MKTLHVLHSDLCCQQFPFSSCALRQVLAEGTHLRACVGPEAPCTGGTCNACSQRQSVCCLAQSGGERGPATWWCNLVARLRPESVDAVPHLHRACFSKVKLWKCLKFQLARFLINGVEDVSTFKPLTRSSAHAVHSIQVYQEDLEEVTWKHERRERLACVGSWAAWNARFVWNHEAISWWRCRKVMGYRPSLSLWAFFVTALFRFSDQSPRFSHPLKKVSGLPRRYIDVATEN